MRFDRIFFKPKLFKTVITIVNSNYNKFESMSDFYTCFVLFDNIFQTNNVNETKENKVVWIRFGIE